MNADFVFSFLYIFVQPALAEPSTDLTPEERYWLLRTLYWAMYGIMVAILTFLLNKTIFLRRGATNISVWILTVIIFFVSLIYMTNMNLTTKIVTGVKAGGLIDISGDMPGTVVMTILFYRLLKKRRSSAKDKSP